MSYRPSDLIELSAPCDPLGYIGSMLQESIVEDILDQLTIFERDYICLRFSIGEYYGEKPKSYAELSKKLKVPRTTLLSFEGRVFQKMKKALFSTVFSNEISHTTKPKIK